ncbi:MAG TPA: PEP-CTERM sorting domain-containing protein [Prosthecobacter sp.]
MSARPTIYWLACIALAAIAAKAADPVVGEEAAGFALPQVDANMVVAVPEPGRALLLFAGMMAMAFTYRKVWLNWKRGA